MKATIFGLAIAAAIFTACNGTGDPSKTTTSQVTPLNTEASDTGVNKASASEVLGNYLELKNALASDNAKQAATAGKSLSESIGKIDKASLSTDQKKVYDDVQAEIKEHGEHIGSNGDKIEHQREHFDMLSKDMYDLIKVMGSGQTLFKDHCPMYNGGKGADWLSEVKEIKNPYLGKKMPTCGSIKEEIQK